jgi:hypothetical protein
MAKPYDPKVFRKELKAFRKSYLKMALKGPIADVCRVDPDARDVNDNPIDGPINLFSIKYHPKKKTAEKVETKFQALWYRLADQPEISLTDIRDRVETYAYSYRNGFDPLTGEKLEGKNMEDALAPAKSAIPPIGDHRNNVIPSEEGMITLKTLICDREFIRAVDNL